MAAVAPYPDEHLKVIKQIGVDHVVYYDMKTMPVDYDDLRAAVRRLAEAGLTMAVVECGPPIDRIVMGKEGRDGQIRAFETALANMGRLGVEVLCYNFMPQVLADAMVVRTTDAALARGGAATTAFRAADLTDATVPHDETPIAIEAMWDNLEYFLRRVIPVAEAAGVKLAMHPDDPPLSPICRLHRIMTSVEAFDRLIALSPSEVNGIALCTGCFLEMGADLPTVAERYRGRIHHMHYRDVAGAPTDFVETFPDDGPTDFVPLFETLRRTGCDSPIRIDHVPRLALEAGPNDGYGFLGHIFATGYLRGMLDAIDGKPGLPRWRDVPPAARAAAYQADRLPPPIRGQLR
ncbi:MAG: mannonate dehydratase [Gemmatimonadales bacterium]